MGSVFKSFVTRPLPDGAQLVTRAGKRVAVWADASGKKRQAPVTAGDPPRIRLRANTFTAQFKDGTGVVRRVPTGCKTLDAARAVLADLEARAEKVKSGIVTQAEQHVAEHADTPVVEHVDAYLEELAHKRGKGARRKINAEHLANVRRSLRQAVDECGFRRLRDLSRTAVDRWVSRLLALPDNAIVDDAGKVTTPARPAARTVNVRLCSLTSWGNWLVESGRLSTNPFARLQKLDEADDVRRQRRALTADELRRLLTVARLRPVAEFGRPTVRIVDDARLAKSRATWKRAELTFDTIADAAERGRGRLRPDEVERREQAGRERALLYAVLVTTGLRKGELAALTVGDVVLDAPQPFVVLPGADAKNGQRATLPLRADVADELRAWVDAKAEAVCRQRVGVAGVAVPPADAPLFDVPTGLVRILDRDLAAAGIPKRDDRGFTVDVHALRHTFATHLVAAGVAPRIAQAALRHSSLELTMQLYTDPRLLDVAGALAALPALPTAGSTAEAARATGTDDAVALSVALTRGRNRPNESLSVSNSNASKKAKATPSTLETRVSRQNPNSSDRTRTGDTRLMKPSAVCVEDLENKPILNVLDERCTTGCTEIESELQRAALAAAVRLVAGLAVTDDDRAAILARLVERTGGKLDD